MLRVRLIDWGLRSYSTGDLKHAELGSEPLHDCLGWAKNTEHYIAYDEDNQPRIATRHLPGGENCGECYVCHMRLVFAEVWRVLRDDGVCFLNLGDSYYGGKGQSAQAWSTEHQDRDTLQKAHHQISGKGETRPSDLPIDGLKPKDLCGIPWRVALALQADGWYLRSDIIWAKPNPMPESVTDRPTKAHEYVFLLAKSQRYYWDQEAVREPVTGGTHARISQDLAAQVGSFRANGGNKVNGPMKAVVRGGTRKIAEEGSGIKSNHSMEAALALTVNDRNLRTVWNIATSPYSGAHFATYPPALAEKCILAGSKPGDIVFDPFSGSGTTGQVALKHGRRYIGNELSAEYINLSKQRLTTQIEFGI